jgi:NADPH2:quinone reductase
MRAIRIHRTGGPEVLQPDEVPAPEAGPGEVLVRADSIGVGLADQLVRTGAYPWMPALPTIPGVEMSGHVAAVGPGVTRLRAGDRVVALGVVERGCYAELLAIDARRVYPCPDGVALPAAACLLNYVAAWHLLHDGARVREGDSVAIVGAAGGFGSALVELAKAAGLATIALVRSPAKAAFARARGADHVVDTAAEDRAARLIAITGGRGVDCYIDPVGGAGFVPLLELLAPAGMLVLYGLIDGWPPEAVFRRQCERMSHSPAVRLFSLHSWDDRPGLVGETVARLTAMIADGRLAPTVFAELPLVAAADAHRMLDAGEVAGKIVLRPAL